VSEEEVQKLNDEELKLMKRFTTVCLLTDSDLTPRARRILRKLVSKGLVIKHSTAEKYWTRVAVDVLVKQRLYEKAMQTLTDVEVKE